MTPKYHPHVGHARTVRGDGRHSPLSAVPRLPGEVRPELHRRRRQDHRRAPPARAAPPTRPRSAIWTRTSRSWTGSTFAAPTNIRPSPATWSASSSSSPGWSRREHAYAVERRRLVRRHVVSRVRQAQPPRPEQPARRGAQGAGARQARPARLRPVEARQRRRAVLAQPVGPRPPRLAHRVLGHGARDARRPDRHPRRRRRPDLPAPRERDRPERVADRQGAVRATLGARRAGHAGRRREDGALGRELHHAGQRSSTSYEPLAVRYFLLRDALPLVADVRAGRRRATGAVMVRGIEDARAALGRACAARSAPSRSTAHGPLDQPAVDAFTDGDGRRLQHARRPRGDLRPGARNQHAARLGGAHGRAGYIAAARWSTCWRCWESTFAAKRPTRSAHIEPYVELLLEIRRKLRDIKQWALADEMRDPPRRSRRDRRRPPGGESTWRLDQTF